MSVSIYSEVAPLRRVLVHRPGPEVLRMTQFELERLLFDDILAPEAAGQEHDALRQILGSRGAEVLEVQELLATALDAAPPDATAALLDRVCDLASRRKLPPVLSQLPHPRLSKALIYGVFWEELDEAPLTLARIRDGLVGEDHMALLPVPNLMFMRDPCISVHDAVVVGRMATRARRRESALVAFALRYGLNTPIRAFPYALDDALEGGDVLVVSREVMLIGCSERTTAETIERLAEEVLFPSLPELQRVYAVIMPRQRSVMHLDTILTQVDDGLFLGHAPMIDGGLPVAMLSRDLGTHLVEGSVLDVLRRELGDVELVPCGGDDPLHQKREQWTDGANAVCMAPGHIVLYARNVRTLRTLEERHGFVSVNVDDPTERAAKLAEASKKRRVVYTFTGSELSRARGGGRCLTMPLSRAIRP